MFTKSSKPWETFFYLASDKEWFFAGGWKEWVDETQNKVFNARDIEKVKTRNERNHYFHEWKAAVELFRKYKLLSLVGQYSATGAAHRNKREIVRQRVSNDVWNAIERPVLDAGRKAGLPDLFVYSEGNENEWFFAEVKGQNVSPTGVLKDDRISDEQVAKSKILDEAAGKCVTRLIEVKIGSPR